MTVAGAITPPYLVMRRLDQLQSTKIANTEGGSGPFFSPDSQWIGFFAGGKLKKVAVTGGAAVTLADAPQARGGTWGDDGFIVFAPTSTSGLSRVAAAGGPVEVLAKLEPGDGTYRWPDAIPGGRVLFTSSTGAAFGESAELAIRDPDGKVRKLVRGASYGRYAASGHLLYLTNSALFAAPFDVDRGELTGAGVPVIEAVANAFGNGSAQFSIARSGAVAYLGGGSVSSDAPVNWLDQTGKISVLRAMPSSWSNPSFSPDGRRLAIDISDGTQSDIWIYDWERDTLSRLTFDAADDMRPVWTPDGTRIAYASRRGDKQNLNIWWQRADGTGEPQRLTDRKAQQMVASFHPNGKSLAFDEVDPAVSMGRDMLVMPLEGDEATGWKPGTPTVFLRTPQNEGSPMFSPDGRWIAYISNETGRNDIYVRPVPRARRQVADFDRRRRRPDLGATGAASSSSRIRADAKIWVSPFSVSGESFQAEKPRLWADAKFVARPRTPSRDLTIHPDGKRFAARGGTGRWRGEGESRGAGVQLLRRTPSRGQGSELDEVRRKPDTPVSRTPTRLIQRRAISCRCFASMPYGSSV